MFNVVLEVLSLIDQSVKVLWLDQTMIFTFPERSRAGLFSEDEADQCRRMWSDTRVIVRAVPVDVNYLPSK